MKPVQNNKTVVNALRFLINELDFIVFPFLKLDNKVYKLSIFCGNLFTPKTNQLIVSSKVFY